MRKPFLFCLSIGAMICVFESQAFSQGQGNGSKLWGLNHGKSAVRTTQPLDGLSRPSGPVSRSGGRLVPASSGAQAGGAQTSGLQQAQSNVNRLPEFRGMTGGRDRAIGKQPAVLDRRVAQAEHLRGVAAGNGNQHLVVTADRMEANATKHQGQAIDDQFNVDVVAGDAAMPTDQSIAETTPGRTSKFWPITGQNPNRATPLKRGFWLRSR